MKLEELEELGRRAVACKHWWWMGGMAVIDRPMWRVVERVGLPPYMVQGYEEESIYGMTPDLSDPATLGCLLHLVREAYGDLSLQPNDAGEYDMLRWHVFIGPHFACTGHATEAEALVAALEAAP